ncbi:MAG: hypothetical protein JNK23_04735 [Opitutaceae bacterium]|nr:hypothetical protein [Opitutaceae bacterium]
MNEEFKRYKEGEQCPELGKKVEMLVYSDENIFVFLDEEYFVQWLTRDGFSTQRAAEVLNRVSYLETISSTHFAGVPKQRGELAEFRRLLGESLARAYVGNIRSANALLDSTENLLHERSGQRARQWYLTAAGLTTLLPVIGAVAFWISRDQLHATLGTAAFEIILCAFLGGVGALISTILSVRKVNLNASFGPQIHYFEGTARIIIGVGFGGLVAAAIKGNLLLGSLNAIADPSIRLACVCALAMIAGTSERIVPNFIKKVEKTAFEHGADATDKNSGRTPTAVSDAPPSSLPRS